jgi:hypothetical protein
MDNFLVHVKSDCVTASVGETVLGMLLLPIADNVLRSQTRCYQLLRKGRIMQGARGVLTHGHHLAIRVRRNTDTDVGGRLIVFPGRRTVPALGSILDHFARVAIAI